MPSTLRPYQETLIFSRLDGPTLTAAARASCVPAGAKIQFDPGFFLYNKAIRVRASGRISCVVTTPGTARLDLQLTSPVPTSVIVFDSLAMNLNVVAKTNVHWTLDVTLAAGLTTLAVQQLFPGPATWVSEAVVGSPLPTAGGSGVLTIPVATAPALGAAFDATVAQTLDLFFTQTVATGSFTLHEYGIEALN